MATISRHGKGWRAQIRRLGYKPLSRTFTLKGHAAKWAERVEAELLGGRYVHEQHTLLEAFDRYSRDVSPTKRGKRWEQLRLRKLGEHPTARRPIARVTSDEIGRWRDDSLAGRFRRRAVSPSTVRREMNLLESVFEVARREWKWVEANPVKDVTKPAQPRARRRRINRSEFRAVVAQLTGPAGREVAAAFELGIETAMRAGEMWSLERRQIDLRARVAHLEKTKNGDERDVALSPRAVRILRGLLADGRERPFTISIGTRDTLFRRARETAGVANLHFHDSRAEATWQLSKRLDVLELADQTGHRDPKSLMLYYRDSAADRAKKLGRRKKP